MPKEGPFEVIVESSIGKKKFEERVVHGIPYVVSIPEQEFRVKVVVHRNERIELCSLPEDINVSLKVEGRDIGYRKHVSILEDSITFLGFRKKETELHSFKFSTPSIREKGENEKISELGSIEVSFFERVKIGKAKKIETSYCRAS